MFIIPAVTDFKSYFVRDFPYGTDPNTSILDVDITRALNESKCYVNEALFCDQDDFTTGYLLLSAHNLVTNIQSSSQGLSGQFEWAYGSKSVGSISVSQSIPSSILENPQYAWLAKTNYGAKYLMMIYPSLMGNIISVAGRTNP